MHIDLIGLAFVLAIAVWQQFSNFKPLAAWFFPYINLLKAPTPPWILLSRWLGLGILGLLVVALINPAVSTRWLPIRNLKTMPKEGRVVTFLVDVSGSMAEKFDQGPKTKIEVARKTVCDLIDAFAKEPRQNLFGLSRFARACFIDCPLTYDTEFVEKQTQKLEPVTIDALNGTSLGYALFKTVRQIEAVESFAEKIGAVTIPRESQSIIIVSDGIEDLHPDDRKDTFRSIPFRAALTLAQAAGVRVYFISVETHGNREFEKEINSMAAQIEETKGRLFKMGINLPVEQIVAAIQEMESSALPPIAFSDRTSLRWLLATLAAILLVIKLVGDFITSRGLL